MTYGRNYQPVIMSTTDMAGAFPPTEENGAAMPPIGHEFNDAGTPVRDGWSI